MEKLISELCFFNMCFPYVLATILCRAETPESNFFFPLSQQKHEEIKSLQVSFPRAQGLGQQDVLISTGHQLITLGPREGKANSEWREL